MRLGKLKQTTRASRCASVALAAVVTAGALAMALPLVAQAQQRSSQDGATEPLVKAAYLLKFGSYIEWPEKAFDGASSPLVIGVLGANANAVADSLSQSASGRTVNGRPVEVRRLRRDDIPTGVHILFVARSERLRLTELLPQLKGQPSLIVSEEEDFSGSTINFVTVDNRVRFDVSLPAHDAGGCKISSRLLSVARKVNTKP